MTPKRPVFLVSRDRAGEAAVLEPSWPVVHVEHLRTFQDLDRLDYDFVFPLISPAVGHVQGMLEFLGLPYAGASMAGFVWALRQNGLQPSLDEGPIEHHILYSGKHPAPEPVALGSELRLLRLSGWSLVTTRRTEATTCVQIEVSPRLIPGTGFLKHLKEQGVSVEAFFHAEIAFGLDRLHTEHSLKTHYKDTI